MTTPLDPEALLEGATVPWTASVEKRPTGGHWYVALDAEENALGEFYGDDHDANVANIRLACAAPDLALECAHLRKVVGVLRGALGAFIEDPQFVVSVGGNPNVVDAMLEHARDALSQADGVGRS